MRKPVALTAQDWITEIKNNTPGTLEQLYSMLRPLFMDFGKRYTQQEEDVLDVFQDAMIVFYENIQTGKLTVLDSTVKTYVFSIGKHLLINKLKKQQKKLFYLIKIH